MVIGDARGLWHTASVFTDEQLGDVLRRSQRLGFLGARPIDEVIAHADAFVKALDEVSGMVVDLGAGGGVPGLVIAQRRPDLHLVLVDRRTKRTDFLEQMVRRIGRDEQLAIRAVDTNDLLVEVSDGRTTPFDAAVARGFGPPMTTLATAVGLVRAGGTIVVSEPPVGDRWDPDAVAEMGALQRDAPDGVAVFERLAR